MNNYKKEKAKTKFINMFIVYLVIIVAVLFLNQNRQYNEGSNTYESVQNEVIQNPEVSVDQYVIDWEKFENTDVIGWICFPGELKYINYPILQGETNKDYIKHLYTGEYNACGSIFLNSHNAFNLSDANSIIYGHNMINESMFHSLRYYTNKDYWMNNQYFYIYLPDGTKHQYQIFAVSDVQDAGPAYKMSFESEDTYGEYIKERKENALYDTGVDVTTKDRIVTLSTCQTFGSSAGKRRIIQAVEVQVSKTQDVASWYNSLAKKHGK